MKKGNSFKKNESLEYSLKGKSTYENSTINDKMKSAQQSQKISVIPSIKNGKKHILYLKNKKDINIKQNESKQSKKFDKTKKNKNSNLRKIISSHRNTQILYKAMTESNFNKYNFKNNKKQSNISHSPDNNYKKDKKSILITKIPKAKNINRNIISQKAYQDTNYIKRNYNKSLNFINNKTYKSQNIQSNSLKKASKDRRKLSFDSIDIKIKLSLKEINISKKNYTPPIKHYLKKIHEKKNNNLSKTFNKNLPKNFIFSTLVYKNKGESMRNKLISLSNNKNIYSYTIPRRKKYNISKNKRMDEFNDTCNSIYNKKLNMTLDRISTRNSTGISTNKLKDKLNYTTQRIKQNVMNKNDNLKRKILSNYIIQGKKNLHYLQFTVSALNKMVNNKNKENKNKTIDFIIQKRSKTIDKDIKSIKRKYKNKNNNNNKYNLIHRNIISRFKNKVKNTIKIENKIISLFS